MKKILLVFTSILVSCSVSSVHRCVVPLPAGYAIDSLRDAFVPASFGASSFDWNKGTLAMEVFSEDLYDMVEISQLAKGDTIFYDGHGIVVNSLTRNGDKIDINGGIPEENGAWIEAYEGGTWRATQFDDHSVYTSLGQVTLPVSKDFTIVDCGVQYTDPCDTIKVDQREYIETHSQESYFFNLNTMVLVEDGIVTSIVRRWIP